jgi:hypothetical protein
MKTDGWTGCLKCPECGADAGQPCRTPKGRIRNSAHDTRPFAIVTPSLLLKPGQDYWYETDNKD